MRGPSTDMFTDSEPSIEEGRDAVRTTMTLDHVASGSAQKDDSVQLVEPSRLDETYQSDETSQLDETYQSDETSQLDATPQVDKADQSSKSKSGTTQNNPSTSGLSFMNLSAINASFSEKSMSDKTIHMEALLYDHVFRTSTP